MTFRTAHGQSRYEVLSKNNKAFQAVLLQDKALILVPEYRRVFPWEWMAEQGIGGDGANVYDQLQAVLDAERMMHLQDWTLLRPGMSTVLMNWTAPLQTYLGNWPHKGTLDLRGSTFTHNTFRNVHFLDVDLRGSALSHCSFKDCDLRGLRLPSKTPCLVERCTFVNCWLPREFEQWFDPMMFQRPGVQLHRDKDQAFLMPGASTR